MSSLTHDDWAAIYDLSEGLWAMCGPHDEPPTDDDRLKMMAGAAIALSADARGQRRDDYRDVADACAALADCGPLPWRDGG